MSSRIEIKWSAHASFLDRIAQLLTDEGYNCLYPARRIFSVYYDAFNHPEYWRGEEGVVPRRKRRIRWYHSSDGFRNEARYEVKISGTDGRLKFTGAADEINYKSPPEILRMREMISSRLINPQAMVSYVRRYFGHCSGRRFTVDHDITYRKVHRFDLKSLSLGTAVRDEFLALEMKADNTVPNLDFAEAVPMTRVRFSKFSRSLEELNIV
jgi:hypothetical protein